jgi:DNA-binding response OmpR family regulator
MPNSFDRPVILCVDDSEMGLSLRKAVLEQEGYWVFIARDAERAMAVCQRHPVSLIISDHMLKGETGVELAARMKAAVPNVPILMLSGTQPESLRNIDCFLHKGEPVPAMLAMVRDLLKRRRS